MIAPACASLRWIVFSMNGQRLNVGGVYGYGTEEEWTQEGKTVLLTPHGFDYLKKLERKIESGDRIVRTEPSRLPS